MSNFMLLLNIIGSLSAAPANQAITFSELMEHVSESDAQFFEANGIDDWDDYSHYLSSLPLSVSSGKGDGETGYVSDSIEDIKSHLERQYPGYDWVRYDDKCALTSDVSGQIPIEMQSDYFPKDDIQAAIDLAGVRDKTSYGGCGPIAMMGILDYFARYLGYDEIMEDPTNSEQRIALAAEILSRANIIPLFGDNTFLYPTHYNDCFDIMMYNRDMLDVLNANDTFNMHGGWKSVYWNQIVENIDKGLPVTMCTGLMCGEGSFAKHYTNIYGYETWNGISNDGGEKMTKEFVKARLNFGLPGEYYCDADILDCAQVGIITYNVDYDFKYSFSASDFDDYFENDEGGGQYFFDPKSISLYVPDGWLLETERLRTSYIENQYLVLSPNRKNAGIAYLDILFTHDLKRLSFDASMWSSKEGVANEDFVVQYYDGGWKDHIVLDLSKLSKIKDNPDSFVALFPENTRRIRFYATHRNPSGSRNKGRVCLDNFEVGFNSADIY